MGAKKKEKKQEQTSVRASVLIEMWRSTLKSRWRSRNKKKEKNRDRKKVQK